MPDHLFWWLLSIACIVWYIAITWYVAVRGAKDIKELLSHLRTKHQTAAQSPAESSNLKKKE